MKNRSKLLLLLGVLVMVFISCEKNSGEGGNVTIAGSVWVNDYNSTFTLLHGEYAAMDEDVFIVYGNNIGYDDKTKTDYLGNYKDSAMQTVNGEIAIIEHVEITQLKGVHIVPQIIIFK